jgi:membrane-anchored mycosin MYCP
MATMQQRRNPGPSTLRRFYAAVAAVLAVGVGLVTTPPLAAPAIAQEACRQQPAPADPIPERPWAQRWFSPERIWPLATGDGVVVAVVDTGVDARHPQLEGRVLRGIDLLPEPAGAHVDCDSHGTAVASVISAGPVDGVGFAGLAPAADILPVRVAERATDASAQNQPVVEPGAFAEAVRWAVDHDARVINASIAFDRNHPVVEAAIAHAVDRGVVVVAAVGNPATDGTVLDPYPATYPGVLGVGAVGYDNAGNLTPTSSFGPGIVDLVAPGVVVTAAAAGSDGHRYMNGSSFAAPFVSAAAALVLSAEPDLTGAEVVDRLLATADRGPGPAAASGHGVVSPYRALTERTVHGVPAAIEPPADVAADPAAEARAAQWRHAIALALAIAAGAVVLGGLAIAGRAALRSGRRYHWQPTQRPDPAPEASAGVAPERLFFTVPAARDRR